MSVIAEILEVFTSIGTWLGTAVNQFIPMFYVAETGLTFLGALACCGLAFSVCFLLIGIIQRFLKFQG